MLGRPDVVGEAEFSSSAQLFRSIRVADIFALDIGGPNNERDIVCDLNIPVHVDLENQCDVVLDGGTR